VLGKAQARVYGMAYAEWKEKFQAPATEEQLARFESRTPLGTFNRCAA
jgi:hypothetical protein